MGRERRGFFDRRDAPGVRVTNGFRIPQQDVERSALTWLVRNLDCATETPNGPVHDRKTEAAAGELVVKYRSNALACSSSGMPQPVSEACR
jgi:hypothetical protein